MEIYTNEIIIISSVTNGFCIHQTFSNSRYNYTIHQYTLNSANSTLFLLPTIASTKIPKAKKFTRIPTKFFTQTSHIPIDC